MGAQLLYEMLVIKLAFSFPLKAISIQNKTHNAFSPKIKPLISLQDEIKGFPCLIPFVTSKYK